MVLTTNFNTEKSRAEGIKARLRTDLNKEIADRKVAVSSEKKAREDVDVV